MRAVSSALVALLLLAAPYPARAATGDHDGDGRSDVFWRNGTTGANAIWKSGDASTQQLTAGVTSRHWNVVGTGDFDGDGRSDEFWRNDTTGANAIWKSGNAATPQAVAGVTNLSWQVVGVGDFDGDGKSDVLWRNTATGANTIWKSGNAATLLAVAGVSNRSWEVVGIGDFDGDGRSDAFWRNTGTGANVIWKSGNAATRQDTVDEERRPKPVRVDSDPSAHPHAERSSDVSGDRGSTDLRRWACDAGRFCITAESPRLREVDRQ